MFKLAYLLALLVVYRSMASCSRSSMYNIVKEEVVVMFRAERREMIKVQPHVKLATNALAAARF